MLQELNSRPFWEYSNGENSSDVRKVTRSVLLCAQPYKRAIVSIHHIIIEFSSQSQRLKEEALHENLTSKY